MFGRRKESQHLPVPAESKENNFAEVLETIKNADLDPQKYIVIGGAALTLCGFARRSHDIDLRLHPDLHDDIAEGRIIIPNQQLSIYPGLDYSVNRRLLAQPDMDSCLLPLDLIQYITSLS